MMMTMVLVVSVLVLVVFQEAETRDNDLSHRFVLVRNLGCS